MSDAVQVDPSNKDMFAAWDGDEGALWASQEAQFESSTRPYRDRLLEAVAVAPTDRVLDIGCGIGRTTRELARRASSGSALGVDISSPMLDLARRRAEEEGVANVTFLQADAQVHPFEPASFDVVCSNFGVMFFGAPDDAFANIARALRSGARLRLMVWQPMADNQWVTALATSVLGQAPPAPPAEAPTPWSFGDPDRVRGILERAGFEDVSFEGIQEQMDFGSTVDDAFDFVRRQGIVRGAVQEMSDADTAEVMDRIRAGIEAHLTPEGVRFDSATWLVSATRA